MGDIWGDGAPDERPARDVTVPSFLLGRHAIANSQFVCFLNEVGRIAGPDGHVFVDLRRAGRIAWTGGRFSCLRGYDSHPVTGVSWEGASAYCGWLAARIGAPVRLPTEVEWQYASLGPRRLKWALGDAFDRRDYVTGCDGPAPVDWGAPSEWGFFNLTGNVFEWVDDEYCFSLGDADAGQRLPQNRVIKGGAFILSDSSNFRNAKRFSCDERSCLSSIGFRVAADVGR